VRRIKRITWGVALLPLAWLVVSGVTGGLGANPIEAFTRGLGDWALRFLLLTLAVTPVRMLTNWGWVSGLRRTFGLIAFTYATLHLLSYVCLDQLFDWSTLYKDMLKRRYITVGAIAYAMLLPLAITSDNRLIRRLGAARWRTLHRLIYLIAPLVVLHFWMMIRAGFDRPMLYGLAAGSLLAMRLVRVTMREAVPSRSAADRG
jgi:sulfoxide reductase heme-binding subunit YedZ